MAGVDFLLTALRRLLLRRRDLRLVLMSATASPDQYDEYFKDAGGVQWVHIEGRTFEVQQFFLEDLFALQLAAGQRPRSVALASHVRSRFADKARPRQGDDIMLGFEVDPFEYEGVYPPEVPELLKKWAGDVSHWAWQDREEAHVAAVVGAIEYVCRHEEEKGAILVFLTGIKMISDVMDALRALDGLGDVIMTVPLHSVLAETDQDLAFRPAPPGVRKVILATTIAESSLTFEDVVFVIDGGRHNSLAYDAVNAIPSLGPQWVCKAALWQRRGRAGRVRPGKSFHLLPRAMAERHLPDYEAPEVQRVPLEESCLLARSLGFGIAPFMAATPSPPDARLVASAVATLESLGALDSRQALTPLGRLLALLPTAPQLGRMVVYGAVLGVLDPVLTVAAVADGDSKPLVRLPNERQGGALQFEQHREIARGLRCHLREQRRQQQQQQQQQQERQDPEQQQQWEQEEPTAAKAAHDAGAPRERRPVGSGGAPRAGRIVEGTVLSSDAAGATIELDGGGGRGFLPRPEGVLRGAMRLLTGSHADIGTVSDHLAAVKIFKVGSRDQTWLGLLE
ncbi:putative ATP-dependent RNA helicase DHX36 [Monoraphidium neglectum]|uniref:Putative ATP-dependent RNA helicase DHX36 n=1 Tax=Monoraphidium neglectum TaxID=145388 RepID=A0A0D2MY89_9CHLO|nr:putative ATP-dependent RNA helicase DHX36 [Monoraphidium neglectum]KIZ07445.1 putative ATP-dependent RNA helicase DHX36 [Monoraphidium neglectum]|eukprot:XP_013906464.1 putative ATP-dependent RNA helicase DHX36 [Monoraphidium neglectum]